MTSTSTKSSKSLSSSSTSSSSSCELYPIDKHIYTHCLLPMTVQNGMYNPKDEEMYPFPLWIHSKQSDTLYPFFNIHFYLQHSLLSKETEKYLFLNKYSTTIHQWIHVVSFDLLLQKLLEFEQTILTFPKHQFEKYIEFQKVLKWLQNYSLFLLNHPNKHNIDLVLLTETKQPSLIFEEQEI